MASSNHYTQVIKSSPLFASTDRIDHNSLLEPMTRAAVTVIIRDAKALGIDLRLFESYRSRERQQLLFAQGATKLRTVGVHHYGLAADLVVYVGAEPTWKFNYAFLGPLAQRHGLVWGGDWAEPGIKHSFVDADHVQRCRKENQNALFAGTWYPDDAFNPTESQDT